MAKLGISDVGVKPQRGNNNSPDARVSTGTPPQLGEIPPTGVSSWADTVKQRLSQARPGQAEKISVEATDTTYQCRVAMDGLVFLVANRGGEAVVEQSVGGILTTTYNTDWLANLLNGR